MEQIATRKSRPKDERVADIDLRIAKHQQHIKTLEAQKKALLSPKTRAKKVGIASVIKMAKDQGMTAEEILKKLGIN